MAADPDLDITDIGTRPDLRHAMGLTALRNGKHIYNGIVDGQGHRRWPGYVSRMADRRRRRGGGCVFAVDSRARQGQGNAQHWLYRQAAGRKLPVQHGPLQSPCPPFPCNWFSQAGLGVSSIRNNCSHLMHLIQLLGPVRSDPDTAETLAPHCNSASRERPRNRKRCP